MSQYHSRCNQSDRFEIGGGVGWRDNRRSTLEGHQRLAPRSKKIDEQRRALITVAPVMRESVMSQSLKASNIPATIPELNPVAIREASVCEIHAAAVVRPGKVIVARPVPLLVDTVWPAIPYLELHAIRVYSICSVQALSTAIGSDGAVLEGPALIITAGAVAHDHWGAIGVAVNR